MVSVEKYNQMLNMNLNLIKIIEGAYHPLKESCWNL